MNGLPGSVGVHQVRTARIRFGGQYSAATHRRNDFLDGCVIEQTPARGLALPVGGVNAALKSSSLGGDVDGDPVTVALRKIAVKESFHGLNVSVRPTRLVAPGPAINRASRRENCETGPGALSVMSGSSAISRKT